MMFFGPRLVHITRAHGVVRAFHSECAQIDMKRSEKNHYHRARDVDDVRRLHEFAALFEIREQHDGAGDAEDHADDGRHPPEQHLLTEVKTTGWRFATSFGEQPAEAHDPLEVAALREVIANEQYDHHRQCAKKYRRDEVVQIFREYRDR